MKALLTGNYAASHAVKLAQAQVIAAYPITPQTQIIEKLAQMCAEGELNAQFINVESEHSAMAACIGAAATGARAFTATSSQGLAYMHELLHWASRSRLPIVMVNVNRALAPGWNVWADQNDSLSQRDTGWMQIYCKDNQEVLDAVLMSYKISEKVLLPTMINLDAFVLSHTSEVVDLPDQKQVTDFLPPYNASLKLDINDPHTFGTLCGPQYYTEFQYNIQKDMEAAVGVIQETMDEFEQTFGRKYQLIDEYKLDDAQTVIITTSTMSQTALIAADKLRENGEKVGVLRIRYLRPFSTDHLHQLLKGKKRAIVLDRNISFGASGIFYQEIKAALCNKPQTPQLIGYVLGLGGRDVRPETIIEIYNSANETQGDNTVLWADTKI